MMRSMNAAVDLSGQAPARVAESWLEGCGPFDGRTEAGEVGGCAAWNPLGQISDPSASGR